MSDNRYQMYRKARHTFTLQVYGIFVATLVLSTLQWLLMFMLNDNTHKEFEGRDFIPIIMFAVGLVLMLIFIFVESVRFITCLNFLIAFLIMESFVIALVGVGIYMENVHFIIALVVAVILIAIFIVLGNVIIHDFTADVIVLFVFFFCLFMGSIYFALFAAIVNSRLSFFIYCIIITMIVLAFVMYHAQAVQGGRFAEMRLNDYFLAALIHYCQFIALLLILCYIDSRIYGNYDDNRHPPTKKPMHQQS